LIFSHFLNKKIMLKLFFIYILYLFFISSYYLAYMNRNYFCEKLWQEKHMIKWKLARTLDELIEALNVGNVSDCLYAMKKIQKEANEQCSTRIIWISYLKSFNHLHLIAFSSQKLLIYIYKFIIYYTFIYTYIYIYILIHIYIYMFMY